MHKLLLLTSSASAFAQSAALSPDGTTLALANQNQVDREPTGSPDGKKLAVLSGALTMLLFDSDEDSVNVVHTFAGAVR